MATGGFMLTSLNRPYTISVRRRGKNVDSSS